MQIKFYFKILTCYKYELKKLFLKRFKNEFIQAFMIKAIKTTLFAIKKQIDSNQK